MKSSERYAEETLRRKASVNGVLPWWAVLTIAKRSLTELPDKYLRHLHHCADCGCVIICNHQGCRINEMVCPECSEKKPYFQGGK